MSTLLARMASWLQRNLPRREQLEHNRWIGPLARRPELWRFTRRSVPRGVAVGLLVGIFALIPGIQIVGAALMCVPSRGNIPLAALMTFLSNPGTTPFILIGSAWVGNRIGFHADLATLETLYASGAGISQWLKWFLSDAAPALLIGLFVISTVTAAVGYVVSSIGWNWWIRRKRRVQQAQLTQVALNRARIDAVLDSGTGQDAG
ncbi:MAG: DUF2062 domain-containing protein [Novosphingobium sp.]|uniref:DUF2062 domain-containing protein n=1 Tax=Novosphingobium sp. TaxID=1874826 RepID=UPI0018030274|nr:DUF2062 domain-containing protein [Novosphingobium sp.]